MRGSLLATKIMGFDYFPCLVSWIFGDIKSANLARIFLDFPFPFPWDAYLGEKIVSCCLFIFVI